ncbi:MAG: right-handed parallel beta-helix repeat-containing protein [Rikenellaceae bacterium]
MKRKLLSILSVCALALTLSSCGGASSNVGAPIDLTVSTSTNNDASYDVYTKVNKAIENGGNTTITFEKGTYHFYPERAHEEFVYISNHADVLARIAFCFKNVENVTIDGGGSTFIFHGRMIPFLMEGCKDMTVKNLKIDFAETFHSEGKIVAVNEGKGTFDMEISKEYPYEIRNGELIYLKSYYEHGLGQAILYDPATKGIAFQTELSTPISTTKPVNKNERFNAQFSYKYKMDMKDDYIRLQGSERRLRAEQLKPGLVRIHNHNKKMPTVGMILASKGEQGFNRFAPAFKVNTTDGFYAEKVIVHHAGGMGFLFENSKDLELFKCQITPSNGRMVSTTADATHFVGCRGTVKLSGCVFRNQLDDASNIHGAYQEVENIIDTHTIGVRVGHHQQLGFDLAQVGDTIGMVRLADSFHDYQKLTVKSINRVNGRYSTVTFNEELPKKIKKGDYCENLSAYPDLIVENCDISRNRARGLLISTPKTTIIRNNFFGTEMEALLLPVESGSWYESGNATNVIIEGNTFKDSNISGFDRGVICFRTDDESKNMAFSNVVIKNNKFDHFDSMIMEVTNVDGLTFEGNTITNSGTFPAQFPNNPVVTVQYSKNVVFKGNTYKGNAKEMVKMLDGSKAIKFN